jgi:hypothetical protein
MAAVAHHHHHRQPPAALVAELGDVVVDLGLQGLQNVATSAVVWT